MSDAQAGDRAVPAASRAALTPAMRQYAQQKAQVPDAILLFRMGDFYEMFYEDAKLAAGLLGLTLTSRSKGDDAIPLAGIPYHALESYLAKLVQAGHKVAISEQVEDPRQARGVVRRAIVRIITPGTVTDEALLETGSSNYLAAVCRQGRDCGLACLELSAGEFWVQSCPPEQVIDELVRLRPSELLVAEAPIDQADPVVEQYRQLVGGAVSQRPAHSFDPYQAERIIHRHFGVSTLAGFGFERMDAGLCAAGAVLDYLAETQKTAASHITAIRRRDQAETLQLDQATYRSLEIEQPIRDQDRRACLLAAIDRTVTAMGRRLLRQWIRYPLRVGESIIARQDAVAELMADATGLGSLRALLRDMADIERIGARVGLARASPRDLAGLGRSLRRLEELQRALESASAAIVVGCRGQLGGLAGLAELLERALRPDPPPTLREGGIIADGYNDELDQLRRVGLDGDRWLAEFQARQIERTGIGSLKVGFNKVFGYYIEVTHKHRQRVPADYVRRQTVRSAERYTTDELKQYENRLLGAQQRARQLEASLFEQLRERVAQQLQPLLAAARAVATIDVLAGLAQLAIERRYCRPELVEQELLEIVDGRHPVLEQIMDQRFVPNDCWLDNRQARLAIITGPNMAGKSTYVRQVALLVLLAQAGSFVPAKSMRWGLVDRLFARVGASDEIARGQSTFMVEMVETANILNNATDKSLVIFDEIGRGTSTFDGLALAWAVSEHVASVVGCRTLFATHYHELTELAELLPGVVNYNVAVREWQDQVIFLHRIVPGGTDKSYGIHVARLAGVPAHVVERSKQILAELEQNFARQSHGAELARCERQADRQLWLFGDPARELLDRLGQIEPDKLTPLQALQLLKDLQAEAARRHGR